MLSTCQNVNDMQIITLKIQVKNYFFFRGFLFFLRYLYVDLNFLKIIYIYIYKLYKPLFFKTLLRQHFFKSFNIVKMMTSAV